MRVRTLSAFLVLATTPAFGATADLVKNASDLPAEVLQKAVKHYFSYCTQSKEKPTPRVAYLSVLGNDPEKALQDSCTTQKLKIMPASQASDDRMHTAKIDLMEAHLESSERIRIQGRVACPALSWGSGLIFLKRKSGWIVAGEAGEGAIESKALMKKLFK